LLVNEVAMSVRQAITKGAMRLKALAQSTLQRRSAEQIVPQRFYLFYREAGRVCVCDATLLIESAYGGYPIALIVGDREYPAVSEDESFFFWNEFVNAAGDTIGYEINCPPQVLRESYLLGGTENVELTEFEARVLLVDDPQATWNCLQGFGTVVYRSNADPRDCLLLMFDWSANRIGYDLGDGPPGGEP
jgi:hypothetical protein